MAHVDAVAWLKSQVMALRGNVGNLAAATVPQPWVAFPSGSFANFTGMARYRQAGSHVELDIEGTATAAGGITIGTLPATPVDLTPLIDRHFAVTYSGTTANVRGFCSAAGSVTVVNAASTGLISATSQLIPLD